MTSTRQTTGPVLLADAITVRADGRDLLSGVELRLSPGELVGLVGPNGAGKSTLIRAVAGLTARAGGTVLLDGRDLDSMPPGHVARMLGYVPQVLPPTYAFTALEIVLMGRYPHLGRLQVERESDRVVAREMMARTQTDSFAHRTVASLSGGERQRVIVARALTQEARVLLLDEPTANLDIRHQLLILDTVRQAVDAGAAALAAIHDLSLAARFCDRLILLADGVVVAEGTPEQVLTPAQLESAYGIRPVVYPDPLTGTLTLSLPDARARRQEQRGAGRTVHLICGGGTGARLMYELTSAGYRVTAGPLGAGDTDRMAADILGIGYIPLPAFSVTGDADHERHLALVRGADATVLCAIPFGAGNLRSLDAAATASTLLTVEDTPIENRDMTGGAATGSFAALNPNARCDGIELVPPAIGEVLAGSVTVG